MKRSKRSFNDFSTKHTPLAALKSSELLCKLYIVLLVHAFILILSFHTKQLENYVKERSILFRVNFLLINCKAEG